MFVSSKYVDIRVKISPILNVKREQRPQREGVFLLQDSGLGAIIHAFPASLMQVVTLQFPSSEQKEGWCPAIAPISDYRSTTTSLQGGMERRKRGFLSVDLLQPFLRFQTDGIGELVQKFLRRPRWLALSVPFFEQ